jgi:hypothetical protein
MPPSIIKGPKKRKASKREKGPEGGFVSATSANPLAYLPPRDLELVNGRIKIWDYRSVHYTVNRAF